MELYCGLKFIELKKAILNNMKTAIDPNFLINMHMLHNQKL